VVLLSPGKEVQNTYIVGEGQEVDAKTASLREGVLRLIYAYYAWDLSYPKHFQLLGVLQNYILQDRETQFFMSQNYLKLCKCLDL
jgi:hypothetical protein